VDSPTSGLESRQRGLILGILAMLRGTHMSNTQTIKETYNGWTNYETWNAALWIGNDEFLYNTAKACVEFAEGENPWLKFVRCMTEGQIGRHLLTTGDGVRWDDEAINAEEMTEMFQEL
jgi:hypothetical protein